MIDYKYIPIIICGDSCILYIRVRMSVCVHAWSCMRVVNADKVA